MAAILVMAAIGAWAVTTDRISYVVTHGISMQPVYHQGDLVFVIKFDTYETGQIAAYHGANGQIEVLHRIIGGDGAAGYVLKGDNNESIDVDNPTAEQMIGRAVLHVPGGGAWLQPILSPTGLGMLSFLFVSGGAGAAKTRRDISRGRRKKRAKGMSGGGGSWATAAVVIKAVSRLHPALRALAAVAALAGAVGLALGVLGWMKPVTETVEGSGRPGESMTFSYSAEVTPSAAYDGTTVYSPDPVFRKLTDLVNLHMQYAGEAGNITVTARLSAENGWHKTLQLMQQKRFTSERYADTVQLDLDSWTQRVKAAGEAIGADMGPITAEITAAVQHDDGSTFAPRISLNLAPLLLTLVGGPDALVVDQSSTGSVVRTRQIGAFGHTVLTAPQARLYAVYLLLMALTAAGIVAAMAARHVPLRTRAQIQRRYPHLIVPVEPMASPPGKPVVVVDTFPALVKLAEKYGQMILTWRRPDGADDFVVRDEGILYRYRIEAAAGTSEAAPATPKPRSPARRAEMPATEGAVTRSGPPSTAATGTEPAGSGSPDQPSPLVPVSEGGLEETSKAEEAARPAEPGDVDGSMATAQAAQSGEPAAPVATSASAKRTPARKRTTKAAASAGPAKAPAKAVAKRSRAKAKVAAAVPPSAGPEQSAVTVGDLPPFGPRTAAPLEVLSSGTRQAHLTPKLSTATASDAEHREPATPSDTQLPEPAGLVGKVSGTLPSEPLDAPAERPHVVPGKPLDASTGEQPDERSEALPGQADSAPAGDRPAPLPESEVSLLERAESEARPSGRIGPGSVSPEAAVSDATEPESPTGGRHRKSEGTDSAEAAGDEQTSPDERIEAVGQTRTDERAEADGRSGTTESAEPSEKAEAAAGSADSVEKAETGAAEGSVDPTAPESIEELKKELAELAEVTTQPEGASEGSSPRTDTPSGPQSEEPKRPARKRGGRRTSRSRKGAPDDPIGTTENTGGELERAPRTPEGLEVEADRKPTAKPERDAHRTPTEKPETDTDRTPAAKPERDAEAARAAMAELAERNRPIADPGPAQEPIYDFLPAAKQPANQLADEDADEL
ncbi:DUF5305 family protein [Actinoplanes utahensis]|uniref:DUF5305 family protein n=1 Tax=Actinoplanes utahensis TaxID=1869 RepID=UPI00068A7544|nr:DUF5305 family protein [Actinoplanes utahensis]GIF27902.1 hypothetical protein Aut01nite_08880 [Actinoplanes utahensis]